MVSERSQLQSGEPSSLQIRLHLVDMFQGFRVQTEPQLRVMICDNVSIPACLSENDTKRTLAELGVHRVVCDRHHHTRLEQHRCSFIHSFMSEWVIQSFVSAQKLNCRGLS